MFVFDLLVSINTVNNNNRDRDYYIHHKGTPNLQSKRKCISKYFKISAASK